VLNDSTSRLPVLSTTFLADSALVLHLAGFHRLHFLAIVSTSFDSF
jgi:hypothetical protein